MANCSLCAESANLDSWLQTRTLRDALKDGPAPLSLLEKQGVIQRFEFSFELAWKTAKDFLEEGGVVISPLTPLQVLKDAFAAKLLSDGQVWIDMLDHRNLLAHTYDCAVFEKAVDAIKTPRRSASSEGASGRALIRH